MSVGKKVSVFPEFDQKSLNQTSLNKPCYVCWQKSQRFSQIRPKIAPFGPKSPIWASLTSCLCLLAKKSAFGQCFGQKLGHFGPFWSKWPRLTSQVCVLPFDSIFLANLVPNLHVSQKWPYWPEIDGHLGKVGVLWQA